MTKEEPDYLSYLLRLWRASEGEALRLRSGRAVWRASLESSHTGERKGFATLDDLFDFLRTQIGAVPDTDGDRETQAERGGGNLVNPVDECPPIDRVPRCKLRS